MYMSTTSNPFKFWKADLSAGLVVFLVAVPLCLGIALASGAPPLSGIIAGIVGGIVVGSLSGSKFGVSGPAAGLTVIVFAAIASLGFKAFLTAVILAGVIQVVLGYLRAGIIGYYFPNSVIRGMLASIGIIIILKQIPHAFGYDADYEGSLAFGQPDGQNTFTELLNFVSYISPGPTLLAITSLVLLFLWEQEFMKKIPLFKIVQGPLVVVALGIAYTLLMQGSSWEIIPEHLVQIQVLDSLMDIGTLLTFPDFGAITNPEVILTAFTIAIVASLETLLCVEATDKLDPDKFITPTNRELKAQGVGNIVSGLIGGLPLTQVIVRSSANLVSGGKTKLSAIFHGALILIFVLFLPVVLNLIPLSVLAAILILVGFKLAKPSSFVEMFNKGWYQFIPFIATIAAILLTDLLVGIGIGLTVGLVFILYSNFKSPFFVDKDAYHENDEFKIVLSQETSFLNKASIMYALRNIPSDSKLTIDASNSVFVDDDVRELIEDFIDHLAIEKNIKTVLIHGERLHSNNSKVHLQEIVDKDNMKSATP